MHASNWFKGKLATSTVAGSLVVSLLANNAPAVPLTGTDYSQNFDTLAFSGTSSSLPADWAFAETPSGDPLSYGTSTGSTTAGNTYSFGAAGSSERALGGLRTGSLIPTFGVSFENAGSTSISDLSISYFGEQWRLGAAGRVDRLDFQFSVDATSLASGNWTDLDALDFSTPNTVGTGSHNGNDAANRTLISGSISGLTLDPNATIWLRWIDFDASGADDGLAIDDFGLHATFLQPVDPGPTNGVPDAGASLGLFGFSIASLCILARRRRTARACRAAD